MERKSGYAQAVLALFAGFVLFCAGGYFVWYSSPAPYRVTSDWHPPVQDGSAAADQSVPEEDGRPDSLLPGEVIDVNTADLYDLQRLPGIGEKRARDIIAYREEHGSFQTVDELDLVPGIGPGILEGLREYASAGEP